MFPTAVLVFTGWQWVTFSTPIATSVAMHDESSELLASLLSEGPRAWLEYERRALLLSGKLTISYVAHEEPQSRRGKVTYEFSRNEKCELVVFGYNDTKQDGKQVSGFEIHGHNPRYAFELRSSSRQGPWLLTRVNVNRVNNRQGPPHTDDKLDYRAFLLKIRNFTIPDLFASPRCRILHCKRSVTESGHDIEISFKCDDDHADLPVSVQGKCVLIPQRLWCLRSYSVQIRTAHSSGDEVVYDDSMQVIRFHETTNGILTPALARGETRTTYQGRTSVSERVIESDLNLPSEAIPDAAFTLSAFGLPEPPGVTWERPTPWWLYGIAVGLALVVLSGILFRVFGRLRSQGIKT